MHIHIRAMSESQSKIYDHLTSVSRPILQHLIKLLIFPQNPNESHWKREVMSFLYDVDKLKGKNRWPSSKFIFKALTTHLDNIQAHVDYVKDTESEYDPVELPTNILISAVSEYFQWIADKLSTYGGVRAADIYNKIDEIIRKYTST